MTLITERTTIARTAPLGTGQLLLDENSGAPVQFIDTDAPARRFLLDLALPWHSDEHQWGAGFIVTDRQTHRWNTPTTLIWGAEGNTASHDLGADVALTVKRDWSTGQLRESYVFENQTDGAVTFRSIGIQTPFNDVYDGASAALESSVHAHVWTGGTWAWTLAQPMNGSGRALGLIVREGTLQAYSIESRNPNTLSNARGHIVLQPTDYGRNPNAMGGQRTITLAPRSSWTLTWTAGWYPDVQAFLEETNPPAEIPRVAVPVNETIHIRTASTVSCDGADVRVDGQNVHITSKDAGMRVVRIGDAQTEVLFHAPLEEVVQDRVRYLLQHQVTRERAGTLAHAFAPINTDTLLTQLTNGWSDWADGSERIGMAVLLVQARIRGVVGDEADAAIDGWAAFAREHLLDDTAAPRRGSQDQHTGPRLYDAPWLALFFSLRHELFHQSGTAKASEDLILAASILERAYELGAERFLAILQSDAVERVADLLDACGDASRARRLRDLLVVSARSFVSLGRQLPAHEVAYEQSIVAPLTSLLGAAYRISGDDVFLPALEERIDWLLAFGGPQPHARLRDIGIRHWDGYWFGRRRQWGDIFPHYWSTLTAVALLRLPATLLTKERRDRAASILASNMANFGRDGWATCAYIFPSTVDSAPAYAADPLANDQDWHLVMWLMLEELGATSLPA